jgi:hypothetical protein
MAVATRIWKTQKGEIRKAYVVRYRDAERKVRQRTFKRWRDAEAWDAQAKSR